MPAASGIGAVLRIRGGRWEKNVSRKRWALETKRSRMEDSCNLVVMLRQKRKKTAPTTGGAIHQSNKIAHANPCTTKGKIFPTLTQRRGGEI